MWRFFRVDSFSDIESRGIAQKVPLLGVQAKIADRRQSARAVCVPNRRKSAKIGKHRRKSAKIGEIRHGLRAFFGGSIWPVPEPRVEGHGGFGEGLRRNMCVATRGLEGRPSEPGAPRAATGGVIFADPVMPNFAEKRLFRQIVAFFDSTHLSVPTFGLPNSCPYRIRPVRAQSSPGQVRLNALHQ